MSRIRRILNAIYEGQSKGSYEVARVLAPKVAKEIENGIRNEPTRGIDLESVAVAVIKELAAKTFISKLVNVRSTRQDMEKRAPTLAIAREVVKTVLATLRKERDINTDELALALINSLVDLLDLGEFVEVLSTRIPPDEEE